MVSTLTPIRCHSVMIVSVLVVFAPVTLLTFMNNWRNTFSVSSGRHDVRLSVQHDDHWFEPGWELLNFYVVFVCVCWPLQFQQSKDMKVR